MIIKNFTHSRRLLLGLVAWAGLGYQASAQSRPGTIQPGPTRPSAELLRARARPTPAASQRTFLANPNPHLDADLQRLYQESVALKSGGAAAQQSLRTTHPELTFGKGAAPTVLVRITAQDVNALLPSLQQRGFVVSASYPKLHFVEGLLPVSQLSGNGQGVEALATQGLLGVVSAYQPEHNAGAVNSQADYVLEAARTRNSRPRNVAGSGVKIGVLSDSFNFLGGAATDVASGDLPAAGVQVLNEGSSTDEGRAMCQLIYDLAPGSALAFSTANGGEGVFAQHIKDLADPTKGNCQVIVDDVRYLTEPFFQDGPVAQAVNQVVAQNGVSYFSSAGNYADASYENNAPQFVTPTGGTKRLLNFDGSAATTDVTQRVTLTATGSFRPFLQWSDPFYTTAGVRTNLDMYLIAVSSTGVAGDTVARGSNNNIALQYPVETFNFTNSAATGTTTFDLIIVVRGGVAPTRVKYIDYGSGATLTEWRTGSSTISGHAAAASAFAVAAVPYFDQQTPETFTSKGGALPFLFSPTGTALTAVETRQKPNITSVDGTDNTFFGSDREGNGLPNFSGTSAAAPHAAAVAALLRSSEPTLTPTQVYARLTASARLLGTTATDPLTGPGLLNAYTAVYGPAVATPTPYSEDLEKTALPLNWVLNTYRAGRAQVVNGFDPASGRYQLLLDAAVTFNAATAVQSTNEAICYIAPAAGADVQLSFRHRRNTAETNEVMPVSYVGNGTSRTDGVALSVDGGTTWYRIYDLATNSTTTYQTSVVNLTQFAAANSLTLGTDVRIKFQQYGGGAGTGATVATRRGRSFDDIAVTSSTPSLVALFNSNQPTTGCPGLQVQYADTSLFKTAATAYAWTFPGGTPATSTLRNPLVTYSTPGHYGVTLSVSNATSTAARTDTGYVFIYGRAPQVRATATSTSVCRGGTVTFSSTAQYCPTAYAWSFPGGTPATSTDPNPGAVTYATPGTYTATLTVTNPYGTATSSFVVDVDGRALPFAENFDSSPTLPRGWTLVRPSTYAWALVDGIIGRSGVASRAIRAPFADDRTKGERPAVYTPAINLTGVASPTLLFDLAYGPFADPAGSTPTDIDSLRIQVVDACSGAVLGNPYSKGALNGLPTSASTPNYFIPASGADWRQETVDLTPYAGKVVIIRFIGYNDFGNHLYLDNIQVGNALLSLTSAASAVGLEVWPVPTPRGTGLNLRLPARSGSVDLRLVDNLGRVVWQQQLTQNGAALERTLALPFAPGLYNLLYSPAGGTPAARRVVLE
ncbi:PKD domain-containing protein [Hymenobacter bucti]|uniref:PKD domain-containing protein n=1 Tax=Hymenobacter bucti TaxID=1844114 RepID=A0ABW4QVA8_9BACT